MSTSTDLAATTEPGPPADVTANALAALTAPPTNDAMARLQEWVTAASQAEALVAPLVHSAFVPAAYKPELGANATPQDRAYAIQVATANATSAVLLGLAIGFDPLTALQQIYLVKGRPGMYAKAKVALLQSRGYEFRTDEYSPQAATVAGRAPGSDRWDPVTITMEMAETAGWTSNAAYKKTPADMLWARAAGRVCDRIGGPVLMGMATAEDLTDAPAIQVEATVGAPVRVTAADILGDNATPEPGPADAANPGVPTYAAPASVDSPADAATADPLMTPEQSSVLHGLLRQLNSNTKAKAKQVIKDLIDKDVDDTKELTEAEAADVIASLQRTVADRAAQDQAEAQP